MLINKLSWDSDFFGYPIGIISLSENESLDEAILYKSSYKLIYISSKNELANFANKIRHVDTKITFKKNILNQNYDLGNSICHSFDSNIHDYSQLKILALESGKYSRFKLDRNFRNGEFEKLYTKWLDESIKKKIAREVFVYTKNNDVVGFITVGKKTSILYDIGLISVSPNYQGQGIGSILIKNAEVYASLQNAHDMQVVTQEQNSNGVNLYIKNGYRVDTKVFIYHYWDI